MRTDCLATCWLAEWGVKQDCTGTVEGTARDAIER